MIEDMVGQTFTSVTGSVGSEEMVFSNSFWKFRFYHYQDCCESVDISEIIGDLDDLIDTPILEAREDSESDSEDYGTYTWTFYNFRTIKGSVTVRWYGSSNGYYSESVSLEKVKQ